MRLDVEALKHQVSDQSRGGNGLSPPDNQGLQNRSGHITYEERGGGRVEGRIEEGLSRGGGGAGAGGGHAGTGESRSELLEVRRRISRQRTTIRVFQQSLTSLPLCNRPSFHISNLSSPLFFDLSLNTSYD